MTDYTNKRFSILGDSVSTLDGYNPPEYLVYYEGYRKFDTDVFFMEDTWWGQVISALGGSLLVNESFSGSLLAKHRECIIPSYGCSDERTSALSEDGTLPDVIMLFMGTNDWGRQMKLYPDEGEKEDLSIFSVAYEKAIEKLRRNYPDAEIWCFTLPINRTDPRTLAIAEGRPPIDRYCEVIRSCAAREGCRVVDLYHAAPEYDTVDGFHPTAKGMKTLSMAVLSCLAQ